MVPRPSIQDLRPGGEALEAQGEVLAVSEDGLELHVRVADRLFGLVGSVRASSCAVMTAFASPWAASASDASMRAGYPRQRRGRLRGTFFPFLRASESAIAMACFRLVTLPPLPPLPLRNVPRFRRRIARPTSLLALGLYLRLPDLLAM
jgi:hypothetical protein